MNPRGRAMLLLLAALISAPALGQVDRRGTAKQELQAQVAEGLPGGMAVATRAHWWAARIVRPAR